ncbi:MarR family winged helix-turn-helix transcriptional regulator [Candidatus Roseilinea sp. NK_OTU-006]|uniref:MarR family winged helix-turn-helix transcriptional regulator n=1 Tax=Candidatus Roseilinea sp. NK_OTU-006 TaxID=2704250 RepID=UPI00145E6658|nr:MarR family transcriptional regulator [Candidatus Roseilinea sp. NK_OTU-006]
MAIEIRILISIIAKFNLRAMEQRLNEALPGMSVLQYGLLRRLADEPCTLSELSNHMLLTPSTLVPAVDKLEREGYLVRGKDPNDRRRAPLIVTEAGRRALQAIPPIHDDDAFIRSVEVLGTERAKRLRALLHQLLMAMTDDPALVEALLANRPERKCRG